jgi:hypothetical protein
MKATLLLGSLSVLTAALPLLAQQPARGFRMFGSLASYDTYLIDTNGVIVHSWHSEHLPGVGARMQSDGRLLRAYLSGEPGIGGSGGGVQEIAFDGTVLWDFRYDGPGVLSHHDIRRLPSGNVLMIAWEDKTIAEATAAGRDPTLMSGDVFRPDHLIEVKPTGPTSGTIVWQWHLWDHLIQDHDPTKANYGVVADHPELLDVNYPRVVPPSGDWNHVNGIDYDPINDLIVISSRAQNEIWVIDHGTTTQEAAGHTGGRRGKGGDFLYRWGNPAAYRRGTTADQMLFAQHAPTFIRPGFLGEGHLLVFNNDLGVPGARYSAVWELELPQDAAGNFVMGPDGRYGPSAPFWSYTAPNKTDFYSAAVSNAQRLPNGNTLICSGWQWWLFEVTPSGQKVWEHYSTDPLPRMYHAHFEDRTLWAGRQEFSTAAGGNVTLNFVGGTDFANHLYVVLGTASGHDLGFVVHGVQVPLNVDFYLLHLLANPNGPPISGSLGTLDAFGRARATFSVPPNFLPPGLHLGHAVVVVDPATLRAVFASNRVPLDVGN